ncbi:MAG: methylated-DNA--[protein]-cysteine S-methyltransferase [bacterium]|jgi:methylated-DNA-[protein]-cysteine S-methyltransferase
MPPGKRQDYMVVETGWGWVGVGFSAAGLISSSLPRESREQVLEELRAHGELVEQVDYPGLRRDLEEYFAGRKVDFRGYTIAWKGYTPFQQRVLAAAAAIPYGEVRSYRWLAIEATGRPGASRAVGGAMAANPLPLIIPCHRVIRSDGDLGGFAGGLELKARLLALEGVELPRKS